MLLLRMPLVDALISTYKGESLARTRIIGIQHILETTHAMFQGLYLLGLRPENISILGKCYSTCRAVYEEMKADGIDVSPASFAYSSHVPFDKLFAEEVASFLESRIHTLKSSNYDRIILLDDGGKCISIFENYINNFPPIIAVEQTSSGYEAIRGLSLSFPVLNVARSPVKLVLESPMIAQAAADRLFNILKRRNITPESALILGGGAIGQAMKKRLSYNMKVRIFDNKHSNQDNIEDLMSKFKLIIGCSGKTSIPHTLHHLLSPQTTLVSVSSSDREFDAFYLRKHLPENQNCREDVLIEKILLLQSGFPVNFDGDRENIDPKLIQLTLALIAAAILEAHSIDPATTKGILPLNQRNENFITEKFPFFTSRD